MPWDPGDLADQLDAAVVGVRGRFASRTDLSLTAAATLTTLRRGGAARLTELAGSEGVSQPSMTALVTRLAGLGLVRRDGDPSDGRVVVVPITEDDVARIAAALQH